MSDVTNFMIGDVVTLKSCNTQMVVYKIEASEREVSFEDLVHCHWFNSEKMLFKIPVQYFC